VRGREEIDVKETAIIEGKTEIKTEGKTEIKTATGTEINITTELEEIAEIGKKEEGTKSETGCSTNQTET